MEKIRIYKFFLFLTFIYLNGSTVIFYKNWLFGPLSFFVSLLFLFYTIFQFYSIKVDSYPKISVKSLLFIFSFSLLIAFVSGASGIGGLSTFDINHHLQKVVDLGKLKWPIYYDEPHSFASYYFGFYAIPGLFFAVFNSLKLVVLFWEALGLFIGLTWIYLFFSQNYLKTVLVFSHSGLLSIIFPLIKHESLIRSKYFFFSEGPWFLLPNYLSLLWVPNQFIYTLITVGCFLYYRNTKNLIFISTLFVSGLFWAPFVAISVGLIYLIHILICIVQDKLWSMNEIVYFVLINLFFASFLILYLIANQTSHSLTFLLNTTYQIRDYVLLMFFEIFVFYFLLKRIYRNQMEIKVLIVILMLLPLYKLGKGNDLYARASAPLMLMVFLYFVKSIDFQKTFLNYVRIFLLLVITLLPAKYFGYSLLNLSFDYNYVETKDVYVRIKRDYQSKQVADQYLMNSDTFFYKYLLNKKR